jgi:mono/diheme cytochrome c family protein
MTQANVKPWLRQQENWMLAAAPEVLDRASPKLLQRMGFQATSVYGLTEGHGMLGSRKEGDPHGDLTRIRRALDDGRYVRVGELTPASARALTPNAFTKCAWTTTGTRSGLARPLRFRGGRDALPLSWFTGPSEPKRPTVNRASRSSYVDSCDRFSTFGACKSQFLPAHVSKEQTPMNRQLVTTSFAAVVAVLCLTASANTAEAGDADAGKHDYETNCSSCHGLTGKGDGPISAALNPRPRDFSTAEFKLDANKSGAPGEDADLQLVIENGALSYGGSPLMAGWPTLTDEQIAQLIVYIRSLKE